MAPKGAGFAFIRKSTHLKAQIHGGTQEKFKSRTEKRGRNCRIRKAFEIAD